MHVEVQRISLIIFDDSEEGERTETMQGKATTTFFENSNIFN
jgi:hypothetical protein